MRSVELRLGIDVGGTNTDAVVLDRDDQLLGKAKVPTTSDVTSGIRSAVDAVLGAGVDRSRITHAMLGTTHATNAVLQRRGLRKVAVLRLGGPATHGVRPLFGWPKDLKAAISVGEAIVEGGIEFDGRELSPLDEEAVRRFCRQVAGDADGIAVTSVFAPVSNRHEVAAEEIIRKELGDEFHISSSHEIGSVGLLERENATVLNAAVTRVAEDVSRSMGEAMAAHGLDATPFFTQNDGTLMALEFALRYPVLTIGSGPANSIRGAAYLTGARDALVADVGGTSADLGVLVGGFPRESGAGVEVGGIRTNFRMPDLVTIALGGGTIISTNGGEVRVGPQSVGYRLTEEALVFGGTVPTLTDAAVAAGRAALGDPAGAEPMSADLRRALEVADSMLAEGIDRVKTSRQPRPLIAVGGGSVVVPDSLPGVSEISRPDHFDVANAIGAAIASVSGEIDRVFHVGPGGREAMLEEASAEATDRAVRAGADPQRVEMVELEEIPLAYLTTPAVRVRAKAAGPLRSV
jgi:N-methylhydantoinase A/oxoprolinase/acetone carboxylase beta subunit